ncbi:MAG: tetratricopeptide repeat protein [Pseudomonadota bacterium]
MTQRQSESKNQRALRFARRLCPGVILEGHLKGSTRSQFVGATLAVDISGFTRLTETFTQDGDRGAELLARIVRSLFAPLVKCVYQHGGFVSHFAGDGFVAIFPAKEETRDSYLEHAVTAAWEMRRALETRSTFDTPIGQFQIDIKFGLSSGAMEWRIVSASGASRRSYHFNGAPLQLCARAQARAESGELVFAPDPQSGLAPPSTIPMSLVDDGFAVLQGEPDLQAATLPYQKKPELDEVAPLFVPHPAIHSRLKGEFRNIVSVFLGVTPDYGWDKLDSVFAGILGLLDRYDGFLKDICSDEKGSYGVFFWGAPVTLERDSERALAFVNDVLEQEGDGVRAGVTYGTAHSGLIGAPWRQEYSCHGSKVNLAARLMAAAPWGEVWCDQQIGESAKRQFAFTALGTKPFKGFADHLPVNKLAGRALGEPASQDLPGLLDRGNEIDQLRRAIEPITEGDFAGATVIYGEPGIGKTALVQGAREAWAEALAANRMNWLTCSADETWAQPFAPFRRCLEAYFEIPPGAKGDERRASFEWGFTSFLSQILNDDLRQELMRTESFLAAVLEIFTPNSLYEQVGQALRQENTLLALKCFFQAESLHQPLVLELEDLHWFDRESMDFLAHLTRGCEGVPLCLVGTCRYDDQGRTIDLGLDPGVPIHRIELGYLSEDSARESAQRLLGGEISESLLEFLMEKSNGNPLYLEQLVLALREGELIERVIHGTLERFELSGAAGDQVPAGIALIVISRLDRLPVPVKETVQMGAVLGQEVYLRLLGRMLRNEQRAERDAAYALAQQIWVEETTHCFRFRHALLRDSAYAMQLHSRRIKLHRLAALAVESLYPPDTPGYYATLAYHHECSGNSAKAIDYLEKAAEDAAQKYQVQAVIGFLERLLNQSLPPAKRIEALAKLARHLNISGLWERSGEITREVLALLDPETFSSLRAQMLINLGDTYRCRNLHDEARRYLDEAIAGCRDSGDRELLARAYLIKAGSHKYGGELRESLQLYELSSDIGEEIADRPILATAWAGQGSAYGLLGEFAKAKALDLKAIELLDELGLKSELSLPLVNVSLECYYMGDHEEALDLFVRSAKLCQEIGERVSLWLSYHFMGCVESAAGRHERAIDHFTQALRIRAEFASDGIPYHTRPYLAEAHFALGDYRQSAQDILDHLDDAERAKGDRSYGYAYLMVARLLIAQRDMLSSKQVERNELKALNDALRTIGLRTGFPPDPERFFSFALQQAIEGNTLALIELVRTLGYYGSFLITNGTDPERGRAYLRVGRDIALHRAMKSEEATIESLAERLEVNLAFSGPAPNLGDIKRALASSA